MKIDVKALLNRTVEFLLGHTRIIMPVVLVACIAATVLIAINARGCAGEEGSEVPEAESVSEEEEAADSLAIPDVPLVLGGNPEVEELIKNYYEAMAEGDLEIAQIIRVDLDELALIRIEEMAKYIEYYDNIDVYMQDGPDENTYVAYVSSLVKFKEIDTLLPGVQSFYIMPDEFNELVIKKSQLEGYVYDYVIALSMQDDVEDLFNKVNVQYNDLIASDRELEEFVAYMAAKINETVGVVLAQMEQPDITADQVRDDPNNNTAAGGETPASTTIMLARATDVVNIRSSDSETADRLDRAIVGQEFTVLEQKGNGWSRVKYKDRDAYIKSEYLEIIGEAGGQPESASSVTVTGKVKATDSVRVRATASTNGTVLGTLHIGEQVDLVEQMSNGWTKVVYGGTVAYVKSEFVQKQ
ncbi:MAG: SH3 domain-containing protein [Lachnospiraceae bacterium]|jgi:uncharacterized protein YgiM (DUF1202 family)|nr:SH3 domain-containing protein [Lachnospiraceae bacterium]